MNQFYSQANQDKWVCELLDYKENGFFIDIGAYDGIQTSNSYYLEKNLNWKGICIEANTHAFTKLQSCRSSINIHAAVSNYDGFCGFGEDRIGGDNQIQCFTLNTILLNHNVTNEIDYLSIDVEGHEHTIFECFDFEKWNIKLMTVEHNLYCDGPEKKNKLFNLLSSKNFIRVINNALCLDTNPSYFNQPYEDWYVNNKYLSLLDENIIKYNQENII